jgi:hypothetical protein
VDERSFRDGDLEVAKQFGGECFVDQDAAVLRVIAELDNVPVTIVCFEKMGLGAASHFSDVPDRGERHWKNRVP